MNINSKALLLSDNAQKIAHLIEASAVVIAIAALFVTWHQIGIAKTQFNKQMQVTRDQFNQQIDSAQKQFSQQLKLTRDQYYELNRPFLTLSENRFIPMGRSLGFTIKNFGQTAATSTSVRVFYKRSDNGADENIVNPQPIGTFYPDEEILFQMPDLCHFFDNMHDRTFNIHIEYKFQDDKCIRYKMPYRLENPCGSTAQGQSREEEDCTQ